MLCGLARHLTNYPAATRTADGTAKQPVVDLAAVDLAVVDLAVVWASGPVLRRGSGCPAIVSWSLVK